MLRTEPSGHEVPRIEMDAAMLLHRSIAVYGPSGTGKTVIVKHILEQLREAVPCAIVVCPSEPTNRNYEGIISSQLIHFAMEWPDPKRPTQRLGGKKGAEEWLKHVWARQSALASSYALGRDLKRLKRLGRHLKPAAQASCTRELGALAARRRELEAAAARTYRHSEARREEAVQKIRGLTEEGERNCLRAHLVADYNQVWRQPALTEGDKACLKNLTLNPNLVIVFDDCGPDLSEIKGNKVLKNMLFRGRHNYVTLVFCLQDDTEFSPALRKNIFINVMASDQTASSVLGRTATTATQRRAVGEYVDTVFSGDEIHRKLIYLRDDPSQQHYYHFTASEYARRPFGSVAVRELCDKVAGATGQISADNPYAARFGRQ